MIFGLASFFGVFRLGLINRLRRGDAAAYPEYAATRTTTAALAYARTGAHTNSAAGTRANATARAGSVRRRPGGQARHGITQVRQIVHGNVNLRRNCYSRFSRQLGVLIADHHRGRGDWLHVKFRQLAFRSLELVTIAASSAAT